jgi:hypothetical protein
MSDKQGVLLIECVISPRDVSSTLPLKNKIDVMLNEPFNGKIKRAFERALELLAFTKADPKNKGLREICYVLKALVDHFCVW